MKSLNIGKMERLKCALQLEKACFVSIPNTLSASLRAKATDELRI